jgi:hypothetical protein
LGGTLPRQSSQPEANSDMQLTHAPHFDLVAAGRLLLRRAGLALGAALVLALSGCGGGGSGGGAGGTVTPPTITSQPASLSVAPGSSASFTVVATGGGLAYQWQRSTDGGLSWSDIAGASVASYSIAAVDASMNGHQFHVVIQNPAGMVVSAAATLTVTGGGTSAPQITTQPVAQSVTAPATATFAVVATGTPAPTFQWQSSTDGGTTFADIAGATGNSYTTPATTTADNGKLFRVIATNTAGTSTSAVAGLTVQAAVAGQAFVYTANAGSTVITGYSVDRATGALGTLPGSPFAGPTSATPMLVLHPAGGFLYAVETNQPRTWVYAIDPANGRLTLTAGSPFATPSSVLAPPVVDPSGRFLIFNASFQLASFAIDSTTGGLTSAGSLVFSTGSSSLEFSQDSQFIFVQDGNAQLRVLRTNPLTLLTDAATIVPIADGARFYSRGSHLLAFRRGVGWTSYVVDGAGALTPVQSLAGLGSNIVAHPNGRCFYSSGSVSGNAPSQSVTFTPIVMTPTTGALTANAPVRISVPGTVSLTEFPLTMSPSGGFGYLTRMDSLLFGNVVPVDLNGDACSIAARSPFDPGPLAQRAVFDSTGSLLFNFSLPTALLFVSTIDPITRVPTQVGGSPFATSGGIGQWGLVVR